MKTVLGLCYALTTSYKFLLRPYCVLIQPRSHHVCFEHVQRPTTSFTSIQTSPRPHYVPTTSYKFLLRPLIFLGRSASVVGTWPGVKGVLVGAVTKKIIKLTRLELFYEEKLWIYTYDSQENNIYITISQIQLVLVAAP